MSDNRLGEQVAHMNEWDKEPTFDTWTDEASGYRCAMVRHPSLKHLCGYVGLPLGHPWHGKGYDDVSMADNDWPRVHGGLTFAGDSLLNDKREPLLPEAGLWWLGFDCAHAGDLAPGLTRYDSDYHLGDIYRDWGYVRRETTELARQAKQTAMALANAP